MAYQHHPQAPAPGPASSKRGSGPVMGLVMGVTLAAMLGSGAWYLLRDRNEAEPVLTAAQIDTIPRLPDPMAPPAPVSDVRNAETVRGTLVLPESSRRALRPEELAGLSREQLRLARAELLARSDASRASGQRSSGAEPPLNTLSDVEAANLRLIEEAEKAR